MGLIQSLPRQKNLLEFALSAGFLIECLQSNIQSIAFYGKNLLHLTPIGKSDA